MGRALCPIVPSRNEAEGRFAWVLCVQTLPIQPLGSFLTAEGQDKRPNLQAPRKTLLTGSSRDFLFGLFMIFCFHYVAIKQTCFASNSPDLTGAGVQLGKRPLVCTPQPWHGAGASLPAPALPASAAASAAHYLYRSRARSVLSPVSAKEGKSLPWKADGCSRVHSLRGAKAGP